MANSDKKQAILDSAFKIFSQKGFYKTTMAEIAKNADVGKGTIYEYFKNKRELFEEMCLFYIEEYIKKMNASVSEIDGPVEKLHSILKSHLVFSNKFQNLVNKLLNEYGSNLGLSPSFKKRMIALYGENLHSIEEIIKEAIRRGDFREIDARVGATFFLDMLNGLSHSLFISREDLKIEDLANKYMDICFRGLKAD